MLRVFFNSAWCTEEEQRALHERLPVSHDYGDRTSVLPSGAQLLGRGQHDQWVAPDLRVRTRKRCTLVDVVATHVGSGNGRKQLESPENILLCMAATVDWHAVGLDAEMLFLKPYVAGQPWPRIGPYMFSFVSFVASVYEDVVMCLSVLRQTALERSQKAHIKLIPLGVGPSIRTRYGDPLGQLLIPAYTTALQYAVMAVVDDTWVQILEFVDSMHGQMSPYVHVPQVQILSSVARDAFDFTRSDCALKAIVAPCDSFCKIGGHEKDKTLAATLANNSNLRETLSTLQPTFLPWPQSAPTCT